MEEKIAIMAENAACGMTYFIPMFKHYRSAWVDPENSIKEGGGSDNVYLVVKVFHRGRPFEPSSRNNLTL